MRNLVFRKNPGFFPHLIIRRHPLYKVTFDSDRRLTIPLNRRRRAKHGGGELQPVLIHVPFLGD